MLIKRLFLLFFIILIFSCMVTTKASPKDLDILHQKQKSLNYLIEEDLSNLVFFSEYDLNYDKKLYYNPAAREIVNQMELAEQHYKNSNVSVAYHEYKNLLKNMPQNDFFYMTLAYKLAETGFFSLANTAMLKVQDKEIWSKHIDFIRQYCFPAIPLKSTEEVFFAGLSSDIIYNNMTDESLLKLETDDNVFTNYDYAKFIRAKAYFAEKNYKEAYTQINKAISANTSNIFYKKLKAEILISLGKEKDGIQVIRQIQNLDIMFTDIQKDLDKVKYHALSKIEKNELKQKYYLAYYFYLNKDYTRAVNELKILIMKGENKDAPRLLGKIYEINNKREEAFRIYTKQINKDKKCAYAHKGLGNIYLSENKYLEALGEYKLADKYQKNNIEIMVALAVTSSKNNDIKQAQKYADKLLKEYPINYKTLYLYSKINNDTGNIKLKTSISQNPIFSGGWLDLAKQALTTGDTTAAEEYINAAAYITTKNERYFYYKSLLNTEKKDFVTALSDIIRAEEISKEKYNIEVKDEQL